ncbi:MAG: PAS domain-containing sensor histidine kinase [Brevundimonas sp.]|uniref:PAS domain-containing sensor histidine kinase n=1 Tax=Brevundimonas sp. TaxID=1871086 RepID=UPI00391A9144
MKGEERRKTSRGRRRSDRHNDGTAVLRLILLVGLLALIFYLAARQGLLGEIWVVAGPLAIGLVAALLQIQHSSAQAQRVWADQERRFRLAVEGARCGVWEWDLVAGSVTVSDYMATLLGLDSAGIFPADAVLARVHPRHREQVEHALLQAASHGVFETSFVVALPEGGIRWIDARGQARGVRAGQHFAHVVGVALDITEARRAKARAQAAESRLRDGIESVSDAFALFDRQGRLVMCNRAFQDAFGFDDAVVRRGAPREELNRIAGLTIRSDQPSPSGRAGQRELELHDGRWLQLSERMTGDGGAVVTAADITPIKMEEKARRRAAEALQATVVQLEASQTELSLLAQKYEVAMTRAEAANQAKSEFLANMSHELRTPLNAINGFSEIMATEMFGPLGDDRYRGYAEDILRSGQHLLSLINDILDMAKIEAGKLTLHLEPVSLEEVCQDVIRLMRGKAEEAGLTLALDAAPLETLDADYRALKQVILNLVSNAIKFTPHGGRVDVLTRRTPEDRYEIAVADTGIGIATADLARLAQPFEQVEGQHAKTNQGTGLGLALSKSLVELHGGTLEMESVLGKGTVVRVTLPVAQPATAAPPVLEEGRPLRVRAA